MKKGNLYLMCGLPGSGKSTFLKNHVRDHTDTIVISRDEIRFSLLKEGEKYFSHEDEVYKILWSTINKELANGKDVFVDQTSLTIKSRVWLLQHVNNYTKSYIIWIDEDIETCLERNELRQGTKAYVPREVIRRMNEQFTEPSLDEGFDAIFHYNSKEKKITYKGVL